MHISTYYIQIQTSAKDATNNFFYRLENTVEKREKMRQ
jgi:hypothetical protein